VLPAAGQDNIIRYDQLTPFANVVDIKRIWRVLKLPELPPTFCHVGLLGWHCHNTTLQPWDPRSLISKDKIPPMPANTSCIICPNGWHGSRRNLVDVLIDLPFVQAASGQQQHNNLPTGFYDMHVLQQEDAQAQQQQQQPQQQHGQQPAAAGSVRP
jgi:hypothetical protein